MLSTSSSNTQALYAQLASLKNDNDTHSPLESVLRSRNLQRPQPADFVDNIVTSFIEIHGDRCSGDDAAVITGFGYISGIKVCIVAQKKGSSTTERIKSHFGMMSPSGYRKVSRICTLAEKFSLPLVSFIDTPGALPTLEAEKSGQGIAIAESILKMISMKTPSLSIIVGEGCSGGALGIGVTDVIGICENAYYSVITPEGCASILWKSTEFRKDAATALKLTARELVETNVVDGIILEPLFGFHENRAFGYFEMKKYVTQNLNMLKLIPLPELLSKRYMKYRSIGMFVK